MKDKETQFQTAFEKQNFDNFIARMGTFPAHGAAVQVRFARKAAVQSIPGLAATLLCEIETVAVFMAMICAG